MTSESMRERFEAKIEEEWRPVVGFEDTHEVSNLGRIKNKKTGNFIFGTVYSRGYVMICLSVNGRVTRGLAHRIVAEAWIGTCPIGYQVDHIDGIRTNNNIANLRYLTQHENIRATVNRGAHAYGQRNGQTKLTDEQVAEIRNAKMNNGRYWGARKLSEKFMVAECQIRRAASFQTFKHLSEAIRKGE